MNQSNVPFQNAPFNNPIGFGHGASSPPVANPGMIAQSTELMRHLSELEKNMADIREKLTGEGQNSGLSPIDPQNIAAVIASACSRVACLVGETSTILTRF